jgi:AcrR family transcriptional regulator
VPRGTLTLDGIVDAAFDFVAQDGLHQFSMPQLARRLGVGVTSIYWYVENRDDLLELVAERVAGIISTAEGAADADRWDERLAAHFREVRAILDRHPGFCELVLRHGFPRTGRRGREEDADYILSHVCVKAMTDAGMDPTAAVRGFHSVALYTLGYAAWSAASPTPAGSKRRRPRVSAVEDGPALSEPSEAGFEFGLQLLITGLRDELADAS